MTEHEDDETSTPKPDAFRDAIRDEDPMTWGRTTDVPPRMSAGMGGADPAVPRERTVEPAPGPIRREEVVRPTTMPTTESSATYVPPRTMERERVVERSTAAPVGRSRFSIGATFLGWSVAAFFTLVFSAIALALVGGNDLADNTLNTTDLATGALIGYLIAAFFAYLIGGYAAGRISLTNGIWHGLGTVAWAIVFAVIAIAAGSYVADLTNLSTRIDFDVNAITGPALLAIGLSVLAMLAGAALGGRLGERYHETRRADVVGRETRRVGGRPL